LNDITGQDPRFKFKQLCLGQRDHRPVHTVITDLHTGLEQQVSVD